MVAVNYRQMFGFEDLHFSWAANYSLYICINFDTKKIKVSADEKYFHTVCLL